ncbi:hypothetical protein PGIGA_G00260670 [Pangasianodon gigas]|uniref:Uncharacterized protein n=1 Tax=Pangasianodon gigas TaxID=30993 RepID=A0ACC5WSY1_PANGG|nr:hypothetical protein [Pangasianodon gigas]
MLVRGTQVMGKFGVKERNLEGQMVVDFAKRMDMAVVNTYFQKREEHRVTYKSGDRSTQVDYILCRRGNLKEISDCKVIVGESVARQHRMVVCRMTLMVCKQKRSKIEIEKKTKWWKLKKEACCEDFRQQLRQALGGQVVLPDDWETTAEVIRVTGRKVLGVSSGKKRKEDKETWWWNEEVQDSIQRKRLAKKKWDMDRTEENRQEYKELQRRVKREVSKAKQEAYDELYTRLDTREGQTDLYRLARQKDRDGKDVQQVRVIKDRDGRVLTSEESVQRRWKEYFEELMNEENEREKRVEGVTSVEQKVDKIRKDEVRNALKRMKSGKAVGPDNIPVEGFRGRAPLGRRGVHLISRCPGPPSALRSRSANPATYGASGRSGLRRAPLPVLARQRSGSGRLAASSEAFAAVTIDLKDAYFHISILPPHRKFLRFAFGGEAYQYRVLTFGLALSSRTFTKCVDAALAPMQLQGIRILNYIDDWLILAHSEQMAARHRDVVLAHMKELGLRLNAEKSVLSPAQRTAYLGVVWDSTTMQARLSPARIESVLTAVARVKNDGEKEIRLTSTQLCVHEE